MKKTLFLISLLSFLLPSFALANRFIGIQVIDKDYLMLHFRDGEVHYRDDATGPSAYLGHSFAEGDDTLLVFGPRLDPAIATHAASWQVSSLDDKTFPTHQLRVVYRKSKPMNTDHTLTSELDHWIFLQLPQSMRQGCSYQVNFPADLGADQTTATVKFDIWTAQSEAVHVNIMGYSPSEAVKAADLYMWLGDGGQRDYKSFEGKKVYLYNVSKRWEPFAIGYLPQLRPTRPVERISLALMSGMLISIQQHQDAIDSLSRTWDVAWTLISVRISITNLIVILYVVTITCVWVNPLTPNT